MLTVGGFLPCVFGSLVVWVCWFGLLFCLGLYMIHWIFLVVILMFADFYGLFGFSVLMVLLALWCFAILILCILLLCL